jgi:hypothetical protein
MDRLLITMDRALVLRQLDRQDMEYVHAQAVMARK